ncbi:MAG TPA: hypothetical protein VGM07_18815 [Stellaceae bacterium]|jgi:hypothetical protein
MTRPAEDCCDRISAAARPRCGPRPGLVALWAFVGCVVAGAIALSTPSMLSLGFTYERNYNEGWNVYNTLRLIHHEVIYDADLWRVNNYPIGSFLLVAGVNSLVGDLLLSGRIVAAAAFVAIGVLAAAATRGFGGDHIDALFGGACAAGFSYLVAPTWVAVDDPQSLAEAIMLGGLVSYLWGEANRGDLLRTALLVALGGFVKPNVVAIPLAITIDLAIRSPRRLWFWVACCAASGAALLGLTELVAGGSFIAHLLSPRTFAWRSAIHNLMKYLRLFKFPLLVALPFSLTIFRGDRLVLAAYGSLSILSAALLSGFEGTSYNMFQDAAVFLGIAAGVLLHELRPRVADLAATGRRVAATALACLALLLAQPILTEGPRAFGRLYRIGDVLAADRRAQSEFAAETHYLAERPGLAICESLLLCYRAGKPFILDPFNSRQYILAGRLNEDRLTQQVAMHEFSVIQVREEICADPATADCRLQAQTFKRFTDRFLLAVARNYKLGRPSQDGAFYIPR